MEIDIEAWEYSLGFKRKFAKSFFTFCCKCFINKSCLLFYKWTHPGIGKLIIVWVISILCSRGHLGRFSICKKSEFFQGVFEGHWIEGQSWYGCKWCLRFFSDMLMSFLYIYSWKYKMCPEIFNLRQLKQCYPVLYPIFTSFYNDWKIKIGVGFDVVDIKDL